MLQTFQHRLYPTREQILTFESTFEVCRRLYNNALAERIDSYKHGKISLNYNDQSASLPILKTSVRSNEYAADTNISTVYSQVAQDALKRLQKAYDNFFRRIKLKQQGAKIKAGFPRFKGIGQYTSFYYPQWNSAVSIQDNHLLLSKIGSVKIKLHRPLVGIPKTCTITRKADGYYASISCNVDPNPLPSTGLEVGIDVGIENFATLSDDHTTIANPRHLKEAHAHLRVCQRRLERRSRYNGKQGKQRKLLAYQSKRRAKAKILLAKAHQKVANCRKDFLHKTSNALIQKFDVIYVENLKISNMLRNHHLAKHIADVGWGYFFEFLIRKAENAARTIIKVNPRNTSQNCSGCGEYVPKNLSQRTHNCPYCGLIAHRDKNAAENIRKVGRDTALVANVIPIHSGSNSFVQVYA